MMMIMIPPKPVNLDYEALVECLLEISCYIFLLSLNLPTKYLHSLLCYYYFKNTLKSLFGKLDVGYKLNAGMLTIAFSIFLLSTHYFTFGRQYGLDTVPIVAIFKTVTYLLGVKYAHIYFGSSWNSAVWTCNELLNC